MLSVFDLLEAGTLEPDLAAFLMARISRGASFLVGAQPGGAGKTTVMCALLNLIPEDCDIVAATGTAVRATSREEPANRRCYVCHEIGPGPYFAYLWGADLRAYCALARKGHVLATNLHADDLDEARDQVCGDNAVPEADFNAFDLALFLRVRRGASGTRRWIEKAYASDDASPHTLIFDRQAGRTALPQPAESERSFLLEGLKTGTRTVADTRRAVLR